MAQTNRAAVLNRLLVERPDEPIVVPWQRGASRQPAESRQAASNEEFAVPWQLPRRRNSQGVKDHAPHPVTVMPDKAAGVQGPRGEAGQGATA